MHRHKYIFYFATLFVFILDQGTKYLVSSHMIPGQSWDPIPALGWIFSITYTANTGMAFGLFPDAGTFLVLVAFVVIVTILLYYRHLPRGNLWLQISLGMQLGGALGNLADRLRLGHVIDFIDFHFWPVSNIADGCMVFGVLLLAYHLLRDGALTNDG
ncbi:MAG: signal peptidase II [Chloroflexi bacterium]|nr:signal peptidase II [Chloroflexota bacterium]